MPHITNLSFTMRDIRRTTRVWPVLVALWLRLWKLERLQLPRRALTVPTISSVAPLRMSPSGKPNPIILRSTRFPNAAEVKSLLSAIAEACPALEDPKTCPITAVNEQRSPIRPRYPLLRRVQTACLRLENAAATRSGPPSSQRAEASRASATLVQVALKALRKHCPTICTIFPNISPDIKTSSSGTMTPTNVADNTLLRLQTVSLCIGYPPEKASPTQLAHYLCLQLPHDCQVELHVAARRVSPVLETPEVREWWLKHHRDLNRFITRVTSVRIALADYHTMTEF